MKELLDPVPVAPHFSFHARQVNRRADEELTALLSFGQRHVSNAWKGKHELANAVVANESDQSDFHVVQRGITYSPHRFACSQVLGFGPILLVAEVQVVLAAGFGQLDTGIVEIQSPQIRFAAPDSVKIGDDGFPPIFSWIGLGTYHVNRVNCSHDFLLGAFCAG